MDLRSFSVNFDSYYSVKSAYQALQTRLTEFNKQHRDNLNGRRRERLRDGSPALKKQQAKFEACRVIYNTDISPLYEDMAGDSCRKYYVYAHLNPSPIKLTSGGVRLFAASIGLKNLPFYIGKGTGERWCTGERSADYRHVVKRFSMTGGDVQKIKLREGLTEIEALQLEAKLIDIFGLFHYGGILVNLDEGYKYETRRSQYYPKEYSFLRTYRKSGQEMPPPQNSEAARAGSLV